jgi:hypothetical protein
MVFSDLVRPPHPTPTVRSATSGRCSARRGPHHCAGNCHVTLCSGAALVDLVRGGSRPGTVAGVVPRLSPSTTPASPCSTTAWSGTSRPLDHPAISSALIIGGSASRRASRDHAAATGGRTAGVIQARATAGLTTRPVPGWLSSSPLSGATPGPSAVERPPQGPWRLLPGGCAPHGGLQQRGHADKTRGWFGLDNLMSSGGSEPHRRAASRSPLFGARVRHLVELRGKATRRP